MKQKEDDSRGYNENDTGYGLSPEEIAKLETMTEAERIEIDEQRNAAAMFLELQRVRAENKRLQQLIKEKDEEINTLESQQDVMAADTVRLLDQIEYQNNSAKEDHDKISKLEFELKSAQELNRELVSFLKQYEFLFDQNGHTRKELNALINKAK